MEASAGGKHLVNEVLRDAMPTDVVEPHLLQGIPQFGTESLQRAGFLMEKSRKINHRDGTVRSVGQCRRRCNGRYQPMVLVSDKLSNDISILQTKFCHREGHEARRVGLETMPLD